jgi:hypothetical protein
MGPTHNIVSGCFSPDVMRRTGVVVRRPLIVAALSFLRQENRDAANGLDQFLPLG